MQVLENKSAGVILKKNRTRSLVNFHPWIFSGAVDRIEGEYEAGDIVSVYSYDNLFQAKGFVNPKSQIVVRVLSFRDESIDSGFFLNRLKQAYEFRKKIIPEETNAWRIVHADGDFLSGLVLDKYNSAVVMQIFSMGMERLKYHWVEWLQEVVRPDIILDRSEAQVLREEGLKSRKTVLSGELNGPITISENGILYEIDLWEGQKTGFFLDQRDNRKRIASLAKGKNILNCFSYTGGFSLAAAANGATTVSVEISEAAQEAARNNFRLNEIDQSRHEFVTANVFEYLRETDGQFDIIVLDPPAFVKKKAAMEQGSRGYKDINRLAFQKIKSEGLVLSCSCSHYVSWDLFQKIIFSAARESGRRVQIIGKFSQPADHAINIYHPEGEYLKSFLLRVL
ncbi:MAG: class I SAM-dependent rRNA methyltransferase [Calditrichia bacterium]